MKNIAIIIILLFVSGLSSCSYDYEMPDYSNAAPLYTIKDLPTEVEREWRQKAIEHGLDLSISQERWEIDVKEKDENGNILYEGTPRFQAANVARDLEIKVRCMGRLKNTDWNYYEICAFRLSTIYKLVISPIPLTVEISKDNTYTIELPSVTEQVYKYDITYGGDVVLLMIDIEKELGYEPSEARMILTEKDTDGNILYQGYKQNVSSVSVSQKGAQTVEAVIECYGWPKGNYNRKVHIGTLKFEEPLRLKEINDKQTVLTTDMPYTFIKQPDI